MLVPALLGATAHAESRDFQAPFEVVGDEVEYLNERDIYVARGNVKIEQEGRTLTARSVIFSNTTRQGIASGDVVVVEGSDTLHADLLHFDVDSLDGVVFHGRLESDESGFEMSGEEIQKTGEKTYHFEKGRFTTCRCPDPEDRDPWTLTADEADLELEGYAKVRNATFEVLGVPVLWAPYAVYPLKRERESGFLFPDVGTSTRNGFEVALPFFWAPREDVGLVLRPEYLSKRGFKPSVDFEYVFGQRGETELYATLIDDREVDPQSPDTPYDQRRWGVAGQHLQDGPFDSWLALDGIYLSDNSMPFDFRDFSLYNPLRFLESSAVAGLWLGPADRVGASLGLGFADDRINPDNQDRDKVLLQRLPQVGLTAVPASLPGPSWLSGFVATGGIQYTYFRANGNVDGEYREEIDADPARLVGDLFFDSGRDALFDGQERDRQGQRSPFDVHRDNFADFGGPEGNGSFDEGEPLADHGNRVIAHPRLSYPLRLADLVEVVPEVGYYGTFYSTDRVGTASRSLLSGNLAVRSQLQGEVTLPFGLGRAQHLVEPHVSWLVLTHPDQDDNPLLVPTTNRPQERLRQLAVENILLDPSDRLSQVDSLVFGVGNRLFDPSFSALRADVDLSTEYRLNDTQWGQIVLQGKAQLPKGWRMRFQSGYALDDLEFAEGLADVGWSHPYGHQAALRYRYIRDIPEFFEDFKPDDRFDGFDQGFQRVNQLGAFGRVQLTPQWAADYLGSFSFENALSLVNMFGLEYLSRCKCWAIRLEAEQDRGQGLQWSLRYKLVGLGDDRAQPFRGPGGAGQRVDVFGNL